MSFTGKPKPFNLPPLTVTADTTLAANAYNVILSNAGGAITIHLPDLDTVIDGFLFMFINQGAGVTTLAAFGAQLIGTTNTLALGPGECLNIVNDIDAGIWSITLGPISSSGGGPPFTSTQIVYVEKGGNDTSGDGSITAPFLTIGHAMSVITDATALKIYEISIGPGNFTEVVSQKAFVGLNGQGPLLTTITGSVNINNTSWTVAGATNASINNLLVTAGITADFTAQSVAAGTYNVLNVESAGALNFTAFNAVTAFNVRSSLCDTSLTSTGGVANLYNTNVLTTLTAAEGTTNSSLNMFNGSANVANVTAAVAGIVTARFLGSCTVTTMTLNGHVVVTAAPGAIPVPDNLTLLGVATLARISEVAFRAGGPLVHYGSSINVAATGTTQGTAFQMTTTYNLFNSVATGVTDGALLPINGATDAGTLCCIKNRGVGILQVYPQLGGTIDAAGANVPTAVVAAASVTFVARSQLNWDTVN